MELQKTIKSEAKLSGIGIHTGDQVKVKFLPAPTNNGITFVRVDLPKRPSIAATINNIVDVFRSPRRTSIGSGDAEIQTIEHLMAALCGLGIDNLVVEIDGEELPGLDGSAKPFFEALKQAGLEEQNAAKKFLHIRQPVWIEDNGTSLVILPDERFRVSYTLNYDHPKIGTQYANFVITDEIFEKEIAPSRTFCLQAEVDELRKQKLGKGANYENTLVVGEQGVIKNDLRFDNEFVRHKISDLIGDLYLLGANIKGHAIAVRSGHPLNIKLLHRLRLQEDRVKTGAISSTPDIPINPDFPLDINDIQRILPHRYPFLLIDRILDLEEDKRAVGIKNVTINDEFFLGHFPGRPVMPGVLIIEAMAQVVGVLMLSNPANHGKLAYFMSLDNAKFRKIVVPGDQLRLEAEVMKLKSKTGQAHTRALVDGKIVAEADLMFALVEA